MQMHWRKVEKDRGSGKSPAGSGCWRSMGRAAICLIICGAFLWRPSQAPAQNADQAEYRVKLAFLYNFAQFIQWPPEVFHDPGAPLNICVAGPNPFQGEIEGSLHGRAVWGHPITIRKLKPGDDPRACQMIFVRASEKKTAGRILAALKGASTLTVGESKGFADMGGVVNITLDENKLRFEINLDAAVQTRLKISSKLLALAKIVKVETSP